MTYDVPSQWPGGFGANVTITNTSSAPVNGWTLGWSFGAGQQVTQLWSGSHTQSGGAVTVTNLSYNSTIAANGGSVGFGFNGSWSGSNPEPTAFTLNGTSCSVS